MGRRVAIVGVGQTFHKSSRPDVNIPELCHEAVMAALEDAELGMQDIDAVVMGNMELFEGRYLQDMWEVDYVGGYLKPGIRVTTGGTTGGTIAYVGFEYVASGIFDRVLVVGFEKQSEGDTRGALKTVADPIWARFITAGAIGAFAKLGKYYMTNYGAGEEHAAMVRLQADKNACRNPYAHLRLGLKSIEEVLKSRPLIPPLKQLDMCPTSEGACAIIVASEEKAKKAAKKPVWVRDWTAAHNEERFCREAPIPLKNLTEAALTIYKRNGITKPRRDISMAEIYSPATWAELVWMEAYHFCEEGEAWRLVEKGIFAPGGEFPVNLSGGVIATNPIGATALIRVAEAALQLRGEAGVYQITRKPKLAFTTAWGGSSWTVAHLLSNSLD